MQQVLDTLKKGHLFMRKYGLSHEQRAQVVRATNGSSRFTDIERILRAADFEEHRHDDRRNNKPGRWDTMVVPEQQAMAVDSDSSSIQFWIVMILVVLNMPWPWIQHALPIPMFNKRLRRSLKYSNVQGKVQEILSYMQELKRRVKELKRSRQPYYPVVALNQATEQSQSFGQGQTQVPLQKTSFKYDKKPQDKSSNKPKQEDSRGSTKKEKANMTESVLVSSFAYIVDTISTDVALISSEDALLASVPDGHAILDTGCTTSETSSRRTTCPNLCLVSFLPWSSRYSRGRRSRPLKV